MNIEASAENRIKVLVRLVAELEQKAVFWEAAWHTLAERLPKETST